MRWCWLCAMNSVTKKKRLRIRLKWLHRAECNAHSQYSFYKILYLFLSDLRHQIQQKDFFFSLKKFCWKFLTSSMRWRFDDACYFELRSYQTQMFSLFLFKRFWSFQYLWFLNDFKEIEHIIAIILNTENQRFEKKDCCKALALSKSWQRLFLTIAMTIRERTLIAWQWYHALKSTWRSNSEASL